LSAAEAVVAQSSETSLAGAVAGNRDAVSKVVEVESVDAFADSVVVHGVGLAAGALVVELT
jgi:hypothetical protein